MFANKKIKGSFAAIIVIVSALLTLTSCTYTTPETEHEATAELATHPVGIVKDGVFNVKKSFFGVEINQATNTWKNARKTWLCGWAPVRDIGKYKNWRGLQATPYSSRHCNMEFHISEDGKNLEAREVNVDYADYKDWPVMFTIPISKHYFYEKDVDSKGRELNKYKKVSDRKNWKLQPFMDLDLNKISFQDKRKDPSVNSWGGANIQSVFDTEYTVEESGKHFFGFTATQTNTYWGNSIQKEIRYNFLEFEGTPGFKKTPYNQDSMANHMNILHILGGRPNGFNQVNYAAHWDLQKPVEFCLNSFPEDSRNYRQIGVDVIEEMNKAMEKIGAVKPGQKAFVVSEKKMKYDFDLRCPSITWVEDPQLSLGAPLGIGLVNADVKTGEIIWGGAVVWGGLIDYIVNRDSESVADALTRNLHEMMANAEGATKNPYYLDINNQMDLSKWSPGFKTIENTSNFGLHKNPESMRNILESMISEREKDLSEGVLAKSLPEYERQEDGTLIEVEGKREINYGALVRSLKGTAEAETFKKLQAAIAEEQSKGEDLQSVFANSTITNESNHIERMKGFANLNSQAQYSATEIEKRDMSKKAGDPQIMAKMISEFMAQRGTVHDLENRVDKHYYSWTTALEGKGPLEKLAAAKSMIKNVTLHELGHVVGLGHQFEGNRMPVRGTVPDKVYDYLAKEAEQNFNYSSIMDYQSGHTEVALPYEKVNIQAQDELVLTYLYKQQYSTYAAGDEDFTFFQVPEHGSIKSKQEVDGKTYVTTYMPQCSDMDAWKAYSPYCRRWDRGQNAPAIVDETFKEYTDSFISRLNSFTGATGSNPWWASYRLWSGTYNVMNRNRAFYDHMRYELTNNSVYNKVFNKLKKNEEALLNFSKACVNPAEAPVGWGVEFAKLTLQPTPGAANAVRLVDIQRAAEGKYSELLGKYKTAIEGLNVRSLDEKAFIALEDKLYKQGVAFTELQKLCRASKKSLDVAKVLLNLKGPDHIKWDYDDAISPTGLRGGNAYYDYSKFWGRYDQLGLLPIKIAALDVLTNTASTLRYWWWNVPKPKFNDPNDGKFGYFSLYPEEFTDVVGTAVKNNMGFGGTVLQDSATMSITNLYMSYFLFRTFFLSNDGKVRGFKSNYIDELKAQTKFNVQIYPVLLDSVTKPGKPKNKVFGFNPRLFNFAKRQLIDLPEAYVLPDRRAIIRGNDSQIIMPLTKVRFLAQSAAYTWALIVTYDKASYDDPLEVFSVKNAVTTLADQELEKCMGGTDGLSSYFNSDDFEGFTVDPNIAIDKLSQDNYEESVDLAFADYKTKLNPSQNGCEESEKGIGLVSATALSLNGWIIPHVYDYIKK